MKWPIGAAAFGHELDSAPPRVYTPRATAREPKRVSVNQSKRRGLIMASLALLTLTLRPIAARAHAILEDSQPPIGGAVPAGKLTLRLRYNSRIDRARSRLTLTRPDHSQVVLPIDPDGPPDIITAQTVLAPGAYSVRWQVLAVDGHITRGDVPFTVTAP
jgi:methionine-rich copper-binding protein CopC